MKTHPISTCRQMASRLFGALTILAVCAAPAPAQAILGTYTTTNPQGGTVTLVLQKDAQGKIGGSLSGNGASFTAQGEMQGDDVAGTLRDAGGGLYFEAHRQGDRLLLILVEPGADGKPDYTKARDLTFTARGGAPVPAPAPAAGIPAGNSGNPLGNPLANPLARGATVAPAPFAGTFTSADVTLILKSDGAGYTGTVKYQGTEFPATAKTTGQSTTGAFRVGGQAFDFTLTANGERYVNLATGGTTYMLVREATAAPAANANPLARGGTPAGTPAPAPAQGASALDQQLIALLTSSAWCSFSFSGTTTFTGGTGGNTNTTRDVFRPDGVFIETTGHEMTNSGAPGNVFGASAGGQQARWKVQNGSLLMSPDGVQWIPLRFDVTLNSAGNPIIKAEGKEYMRCN